MEELANMHRYGSENPVLDEQVRKEAEQKPFGIKTSPCTCALCEYSRKVDAIIESRDPDKLIELVRELHNTNYNIGADLEYCQCVLNGSWPSAVEQLELALTRAKQIQKERNETSPIAGNVQKLGES